MTTMQNDASTPSHEELKDLCTFFLNYGTALYGSGATCIRIEKNLNRMAAAFDTQIEITVLPTHILITLWDETHSHSYSSTRCTPEAPISLYANTELSKLSWAVAEHRTDLRGAIARYGEIMDSKRIPRYVVLGLASCANASFCRLFGGDPASMAIVFIATLAGFYLKQTLLSDHIDSRIVTFAAAFLSSVIGAAGYVFHLGATPELALGTSVLYLIPGIPYINCMSDMLEGHYLCFFSRFVQSSVLTACLALGLSGGLILMNLQML